VIQPHAEQVEIVIPSTAEVRKELKLEPSQRQVKSRMVALLKEHVDSPGRVRICQGRIPVSLCTSYHGEKTVL
jgi:hypothetical protein